VWSGKGDENELGRKEMNECNLSANVGNAPNPGRGIANERFLKPAVRLTEIMLFEMAGLLDGADCPLWMAPALQA
jgi:hypothetical protein